MKREENFGCPVHHRVFFSEQEVKEHIKEKCHPENIFKLKEEDLLGEMSYNIISAAIDSLNITEKEKEQMHRQAYLW